jgi:hypothetical protein
MPWQPAVTDRVHQFAAAEADIGELAIVEFHQSVEVTSNDAPVLDPLEQSLYGTGRDRPQGRAADAGALCVVWQE